jgi:D-alanyl-D-alanine carboxypeptidase
MTSAATTALGAQLTDVIDRALGGMPDCPGVLLSVRRPHEEPLSIARPAEGSEPFAPDAVFRTASVTKSVTALAIMRLVEQGRFELDDAVAPLLPDAVAALLPRLQPAPEPVTLRLLLTHTAGLHDYWSDPRWMPAVRATPDREIPPIELVSWSAEHGSPVGRPGERFHYTDAGYGLLGFVVEQATGLDLAAAYRALLPMSELPRTWLEGREPPLVAESGRAPMRTFGEDPWPWHPSYDTHAAGGLVSSSGDLAHLVELVATGQVVSADSLTAMRQTVPAMPGADYGLGVFGLHGRDAQDRSWGHFGYHGAFAFWSPAAGAAIAGSVLCTDPPGADRPSARLVRELIAVVAGH